MLEGGQNVIFAKITEKGNERFSLEGPSGNYQKLRGLEEEGQNEETKSGGAKVQYSKLSAMESDQATHGRRLAIWSIGLAQARVEEGQAIIISRHWASGWPDFREIQTRSFGRLVETCKWLFRPREGVSRSIQGQASCLRRWVSHPRLFGSSIFSYK